MKRSDRSKANATGMTVADIPCAPMTKPMTMSEADRNVRNIPVRLKASL